MYKTRRSSTETKDTKTSLRTLAQKRMTAFWDMPPGILVEVDQLFRGSYCLHHQGDEIKRRRISQGYHLHNRRRKNLKYHTNLYKFITCHIERPKQCAFYSQIFTSRNSAKETCY
jgi:hypothetical protein